MLKCVFGLGWEGGGMGVVEGWYNCFFLALFHYQMALSDIVLCLCSTEEHQGLADGVRSVSSCQRLLLSFLVFLTIVNVKIICLLFRK